MCDREKLQKLTVKQLRELCAKKNVSVSGRKAALVNRLLETVRESDSDSDDSLFSALDVMSSTRKEKKNATAAKKEDAPRASQFTFNDIGDSLEKFSGESADSDVCEWLEEFEKACETFGWNDVQKFVYGRRLLSGTAKLFVQSSTGLNDWGTLKNALEEEFEVKVSSAEIHELLRGRKKKSDESFLQYIYHMQSIAKRGHIDEETVCEYVVRGIVDDPVNKVGLYGARTLAELKERVKQYEKMKSQMRDVSRSAKVFGKSERVKKSETPRTARSEKSESAHKASDGVLQLWKPRPLRERLRGEVARAEVFRVQRVRASSE